MGQAIVTYRFYMHGRKHFTQTGWQAHSAAYGHGKDLQSMNLRGRVHVVTGANSGIGREVCEYLVGRGSRVYMVCRNADRGKQARDEIAEKIGDGADVHLMVADCGLAADMRRVANELKEKEVAGIDCLVCNAGAMTPKRTLTSEGHEVTFATHFLHGTYLLSQELRPLLSKSGARVVAVSSGGMLNVKYDHGYATGTKGSYDKQLSYAYAKRGQVLLCEYLANQPGEQITFVSCHPGWTDTPGVEFAYGSMKKKWLQPMRTLWEGAEGICWLCVADADQIKAGSFYLDRQPQKTILASWTSNSKKEVEEMVAALGAATSS